MRIPFSDDSLGAEAAADAIPIEDMPEQLAQALPESISEIGKRAAEFAHTYSFELRELFEKCLAESPEAIKLIVGCRLPQLAYYPFELHLFDDGVLIAFRSLVADQGQGCPIRYVEGEKLADFFNSKKEQFFTFADPYLGFSYHGTSVALNNEIAEQIAPGCVHMLVRGEEGQNEVAVYPKLILLGLNFLRSESVAKVAREQAGTLFREGISERRLVTKSSALRMLKQFRDLLDRSEREEEIQVFLKQHPELLFPHHIRCVPKPRIKNPIGGKDRIPDFAFSVQVEGGMDWVFVEIEKADKKVFTTREDFQFSSRFTQAKQQLLQWEALVEDDLKGFRSQFTGIRRPEYLLVFGRDSELDEERRKHMRLEFAQASRRSFLTYDDVANRFEKLLENLFHSRGE